MSISFFIVVVDINECDSNPCVNEGTCTDGDNLFTCACAAGFMGAACDQRKIFLSTITVYKVYNYYIILL